MLEYAEELRRIAQNHNDCNIDDEFERDGELLNEIADYLEDVYYDSLDRYDLQ